MKSDYVARFGMSKDASTCLKGLACLLIVLHHWCNAMMTVWHNNLVIDTIALRGGVTGVAIFFFLSSYGLTRSQSGRHDGVLTFFKKRLVKVLIPLLVTNLLWFVFRYHGQGFVHSVCQLLNLCDLLDGVTWFCNVILVCYVVFYISNLMKPLWGRLCCNWVLTLLLAVIFTYRWPNDSYLVYSLIAFPLGFSIALLQERFSFWQLMTRVVLPILLILMGCAWFIEKCRNLLMINAYCVILVALLMSMWLVSLRFDSFLGDVKVAFKPVLMATGVCSYEVYLLHNKALMLHSESATSVWFPLTFLLLIVPLAVALYKFDNKITRFLR